MDWHELPVCLAIHEPAPDRSVGREHPYLSSVCLKDRKPTANKQSQSPQKKHRVQITRQSVGVLDQLDQLLTESQVWIDQAVRVPIECLIEFSNSTAC